MRILTEPTYLQTWAGWCNFAQTFRDWPIQVAVNLLSLSRIGRKLWIGFETTYISTLYTTLFFFFTYRKKDPISFNGRKVAYISKPFIQIWWKRHGSVMAQTVLLSKLFQFLFSEIIRKKHCTFFLYGSLMGLNFDQFWFLPVPYTYTHGH